MKTILLISNLEAFLERNNSLLNRAGFIILTATSAEEALQIYRRQPVDLIISLLDLPGMRGDALCRSIRQDDNLRRVPFILVCYESDLERASNCGANACVIKPVHPELLLTQISRFLAIPTRRKYRASFNASVKGTRGTQEFSGMTRNISVSGLLCECSLHLNQEDEITNLLLDLDAQPIVANGRVVWAESQPSGMYNYGVHFTNIAPECRDRIAQFVGNSQ